MSNTYETAYRTIDVTIQIVGVWRGGIYIDLFWGHNLESAFEVINVYDYRAGKLQDM